MRNRKVFVGIKVIRIGYATSSKICAYIGSIINCAMTIGMLNECFFIFISVSPTVKYGANLIW